MFRKKWLWVYRGMLSMHDNCGHCGQKFEIEPGFYYGALWTSYPLVLFTELPLIFIAIFSGWMTPWFWYGIMLGTFVLIFPLVLRLGRSLWIHLWVKYDANARNSS
jgi:hypothetical protein